jgi:hypothetical protein
MTSTNDTYSSAREGVNDAVAPFWYEDKRGDVSDDIGKLMVNFKLTNSRIEAQKQTTFEINGLPTSLNNPAKHWGGGKDMSFEKVLKNAKGQPMRYLIKQLQEKQGQGMLVCPPGGLSVDVKQLDTLDDYVAYMPDAWFENTSDDGLTQHRIILAIIDGAPRNIREHKIFQALRKLVEMERGGPKEMYDVYIYFLIVLFNWFEYENIHWENLREEQSKDEKLQSVLKLRDLHRDHTTAFNLRNEIDAYINNSWLYKDTDGVALRDIRNKCLLQGCIFEQRSVAGIQQSIENRINEVLASQRFVGVIPERRDVSRITIAYNPTALYDEWTVDELITSFFRSLAKKKIRLDDHRRAIREKIHASFFNSCARSNMTFSTTLKLGMSILYDKKVLSVFNLDPAGIDPKDCVACNGKFNVELIFENCASGSITPPTLQYMVKIDSKMKQITDILSPATTFDLNYAFKLLRKEFSEETTMAVLKDLRTQLSSIREDDDLNQLIPYSPVAQTQTTHKRFPQYTLQSRINEYEAISAAYEKNLQGHLDELVKLKKMAMRFPDREEITPAEQGELESILAEIDKYDHLYKETSELYKQSAKAIGLITDEERAEAQKEIREIEDVRRKTIAQLKGGRRHQSGIHSLSRGQDESGSGTDTDDEDEEEEKYGNLEFDYSHIKFGDLSSKFYKEFPIAETVSPGDKTVVVKRASLGDGNHPFQSIGLVGFEGSNRRPRISIIGAEGNVVKIVPEEVASRHPLAQKFEILSYGLNVLDVSNINLNSPSFRENGEAIVGFYPHQIKIIETVSDALSRNVDSTVILEASVGAGKTTVVLGVAKAMEQIVIRNESDPNRRPFLIYASDGLNILHETFERATRNNLNALAACRIPTNYQGEHIGIMFRAGGSHRDAKKRIPDDELKSSLNSCSIIFCHFRTLAFLLKMLEQTDTHGRAKWTNRPFSIIIDEVKVRGLNNESEHALASILAYQPLKNSRIFNRAKNIAIFSASVNSDGPIRYYTNDARGVRFLTNSTVLVPTELRQMSYDPSSGNNYLLDPYVGFDDPYIIKKVKENAFFRRFISNSAVQHLLSAVRERGHSADDNEKLAVLEARAEDYLDRMDKYFVTENSTIYNMFSSHKEVRRLVPQLFRSTTYNSPEAHEVTIENIFTTYITRINRIPEEIIAKCWYIKDLCDQITSDGTQSDLEKEQARLVKAYIEHTEGTFAFNENVSGFISRYYALNTKLVTRQDEATAIITKLPKHRIRSIGKAFAQIIQLHGYIHSFEKWSKDNPDDMKDPKGEKMLASYFSRHVDDFRTIRTCKYYAMVGTTQPTVLMARVYDGVAERLERVINEFKQKHHALIADAVVYDKTDHTGSRENLAKELYAEFSRYKDEADEDHTKIVLLNAGTDAMPHNKEVRTFGLWLIYMSESPKLSPERRKLFMNIGSNKETIEFWKERAKLRGTRHERREGLTHTGELAMPEDSARTERTGSRTRQLGIIQAFNKYSEETYRPGNRVEELRGHIHELNKRCNAILVQHGFVHTQEVNMNREMLMEVKTKADIFGIMGVIAPGTSDEMRFYSRNRYNRFFSDKKFAHGIDTPLEAVILTQTVDKGQGEGATFSADDILQMSGRCGRPSRSTISVVYMADSTYRKCLVGDKGDITNLLLRYKYYRLPAGNGTIEGDMLPYSRYDEMEVNALFGRMIDKNVF